MSTANEKLAELLRDPRGNEKYKDPTYYDRRAEVFDQLATEDPKLRGEARLFAASARAHAAKLRRERREGARR